MGPPPPGSGGLPRAQVSLPPAPAAGQQVRVRPHHAGHHAAAQVQGSHGHRGHQDLADRPGHGCVCSTPPDGPVSSAASAREGWARAAKERGEGAAETGPGSCTPGGQWLPAGASTQLTGSLKHVCARGEQRSSSEACEPVSSHVPTVVAHTLIAPPATGQCCHTPHTAHGRTGRAENLCSLCLVLSRQPGAEFLPHRRYRKQAAPSRLLGDSRCTATWVPASEQTGVPSCQSHLEDTCPWLPGAAPERQSGAVLLVPARHLRQARGHVDGALAAAELVHPGSPRLRHLHVALTSAGEQSVPLPAHCHRPTRPRLRAGPHRMTSP